MALDPRALDDNYIRLERWGRTTGKLTPLVQAQVDRLRGFDIKCKQCMLLAEDNKLCEGTRQVFDEEQSDYRKRVMLVMMPCYKLTSEREYEAIDTRMKLAGIPPRMLADIANNRNHRTDAKIEVVNGELVFDGDKLNTFCRDTYSDELNRAIFEYMFAMAETGYQPKYFYVGDFTRYVQQAGSKYTLDQRVADVLEPDWLVVDRPDYWAGMEYVRNMFFEVLRERISKQKPTTLLVKPGTIKTRNELESQLFEDSEQWPNFNLI